MMQGGLACGSWQYWLVTLAALPWTAAFFVGVRRHMLAAAHEAKVFTLGAMEWMGSETYDFDC